MPRLTIDERPVEVPEGATILDAARTLGIDVPALCFRQGCTPSTSCLACVVKIGDDDRLVPSCATAAVEGMRVKSETEPVRAARRTALELLLSDHLGDCTAPCQLGCPAQMDIPKMLRQIAAGQTREAVATVKSALALPAVLGRICPAPCENVCRRSDLDAPLSIRSLHGSIAEADLASPEPYTPACQPPTGRRAAIVGAGPTGLSAAYYLRQFGHECVVFDENPRSGGRLLRETTEDQLPRNVLEAELVAIRRLGVAFRANVRIGAGGELTKLLGQFDAVLLACGATGRAQAPGWGLSVTPRGIQATPHTCETAVPRVFAAGVAVRGKAIVVRSVADGREAAVAIDQFLHDLKPSGLPPPLSVHIGRMHGEELARFAGENCEKRAVSPLPPAEAGRCLQCDCRGADSCKLRAYAACYGANPRRFKAERRPFECDASHPEVVYEPGKCIACGLCVQIASAAGEPLGLTFVGRGFDVRVAVPLDRPLSEALTRAAAASVAACPTAALAWKARS